MAGTIAVAVANAGGAVAWVVPTYKNARPVWRFVENAVAPLGKRVRLNRADKTVEFPSGGWLGVYSADNDVALRGDDFDLVIPEEAAQMQESTITDVIMPTLADRHGRLMAISTPKGLNWFRDAWVQALNDDTGESAAFTAPSSANPLPAIQEAFKRAKETLPERSFRQEWLAEFLTDGGVVFRGVDDVVRKHKCDKDCPPDCKERFPCKPYDGEFVCGIDWGRVNDYTDITIMDAQTRREVDHARFKEVGWDLQRRFVKDVLSPWHIVGGLAEANSIGQPNIEALQRDGIPIVGQYTSNASKQLMVEELVLAIEQRIISLGDKPEIAELKSYEQSTLPSGMIRYEAPARIHDDYVMSLMLANHACVQTPVQLSDDIVRLIYA